MYSTGTGQTPLVILCECDNGHLLFNEEGEGEFIDYLRNLKLFKKARTMVQSANGVREHEASQLIKWYHFALVVGRMIYGYLWRTLLLSVTCQMPVVIGNKHYQPYLHNYLVIPQYISRTIYRRDKETKRSFRFSLCRSDLQRVDTLF
jgi:hypothetical protein